MKKKNYLSFTRIYDGHWTCRLRRIKKKQLTAQNPILVTD